MRKILLPIIVVVVLVGLWFAFKAYTRTNEDLENKSPDFTVQSSALINEFAKDTATANAKYIDKIIEVSGNIKMIDANGNPVVIALGSQGEMSSVLCSMDSTHAEKYHGLKEGDLVTLKGICTGGVTEEIFGTDVKLNRCVVSPMKN